jgi:hypothetical protein
MTDGCNAVEHFKSCLGDLLPQPCVAAPLGAFENIRFGRIECRAGHPENPFAHERTLQALARCVVPLGQATHSPR